MPHFFGGRVREERKTSLTISYFIYNLWVISLYAPSNYGSLGTEIAFLKCAYYKYVFLFAAKIYRNEGFLRFSPA